MRTTLEITKNQNEITFNVIDFTPPVFKDRVDFNAFVEQIKQDENIILNEGMNLLHFHIRLSNDKKNIVRYWM